MNMNIFFNEIAIVLLFTSLAINLILIANNFKNNKKKNTIKENENNFKNIHNQALKETLYNSILNHKLLNSIDKYNEIITKLNLKHEYLNLFFRGLLVCKVNSVINLINDFIDKYKDETLKRYELVKLIDNLTVEIIKDYKKKYKCVIINILTELAELNEASNRQKNRINLYSNKIYNLIIRKFDEYHDKNITWIYEFINNLLDSELIEYNEEVMRQYLDIIKNALKIAIFDAEKIFKGFNGDLTEIIIEMIKDKLYSEETAIVLDTEKIYKCNE